MVVFPLGFVGRVETGLIGAVASGFVIVRKWKVSDHRTQSLVVIMVLEHDQDRHAALQIPMQRGVVQKVGEKAVSIVQAACTARGGVEKQVWRGFTLSDHRGGINVRLQMRHQPGRRESVPDPADVAGSRPRNASA